MPTEARIPLTRDRIVEAALALADSAGVEAVTMRRLGDELGYEAMSLYRHVANKGDLLDGMLDLVIEEWQLLEGGDWVEDTRASACSVHDALRRHPWAASLLQTGGHVRPGGLAYMEWLLRRLAAAGFDADSTYSVYHLIDGHIFGFSLWEIAHTAVPLDDATVEALFRSIPWDSYPHLTQHRDQHFEDGPHRDARAFEVGLDLILDGLRATLAE